MKVSLVVSIYNTAQYIEQCVRSLAEQTLEDIEIVLVNDATQDESMAIVEKTLADYPLRRHQVQIVNHERNLGLGKTRRDGFAVSKGDYVIFVDSDDFADTRMAELLYNKAVDSSADLVICGFYRYNGTKRVPDTIVPQGSTETGDNIREDIINRRVSPFIWCRLIKREVLADRRILWPVGNLGDDTVIGSQEAYYAKTISYVDEPLYYYRYNIDSITKRRDEKIILNNYNSFKKNVEIYLQFLEQEGITEKYGRGVVINKLRLKNRVLPLTDNPRYRKLWWDTYPEINKVLLFGNKYYKPSYREWLWMGAIMSGCYCRYRRKLEKKKYRPSDEWL